MHKIRFTFMLALLSAGILLASCKKDKNDEPTPSSSVTTDTTQVTPTPDENPQNNDNNEGDNPQNPDEGDNNEGDNPPISNTISIKVAIEAIEGIDNPSFTAEDVLTISEGETKLGTLTLQDTDGNFSGELTTAPSNEGAELTAAIILNEGSEISSSTETKSDLIKKCAHKYTGTFKYKTDTKVMLTDNKAYIEIIMSPLQHNIDVTIGSEKKNYAMSDEGEVWIAVDGGTTFTTNFTYKETATAGKITTIKREGFVDLGIEGGILWADKNIGATNVYDYGDYFAWGETVPYYADGHSTDSPCNDWRTVGERTFSGYNWTNYAYGKGSKELTKYCNKSEYGKDKFTDELTVLESDDDVATAANAKWSMPTTEEFAALKSSCYWVWTADYSGKKGYIVYKVKEAEHAGKVKYASSGDDYASSYTTDDTHIFLPAAGYRNKSDLHSAGSYGLYWSSSLYTDYPYDAYDLFFDDGYVDAQNYDSRYYGQSVRAVRHK